MKKISNIEPFIVNINCELDHALTKIDQNKCGVIFVVDDESRFIGAITDGDIRRHMINNKKFQMDTMIRKIINPNAKRVYYEEVEKITKDDFSEGRHHIPVVDKNERILFLITNHDVSITIGGVEISQKSPPFIIAEIGNNHQGCLNTAKVLIEAAKDADVDCVKFQMRNMKELYGEAQNEKKDAEDLGSQYTLDLLAKFQLSENELFEAFDYTKQLGLIPLCTPWDLTSLSKLENYGMSAYKVASADLTNDQLLIALAQTGKSVLCSTGMSTEMEIKNAAELLNQHAAHYMFLHCNSTYPTPYKDVNLQYLHKLKKLSGNFVGYSGHERGMHIPLGAVAMGAKVIEKHITLDTSQEGADHKVSLLPKQFKQMVKQIHELNEAFGENDYRRELTQGELINRQTLAKSIFSNCDISEGELIRREMLIIRGPGIGLQPNRLEELIGKTCNRNIKNGTPFYTTDLVGNVNKKRKYNFGRDFGVPVRYHDFKKISIGTNLDFVEFHLSYNDLDVNLVDYLEVQNDLQFSVHCPELFNGDHLLDLSAREKSYRKISIDNFKKVIETSLNLKKFFPKTDRPILVVNAGGWNVNGFENQIQKQERYEILQKSLNETDLSSIQLAIQTMPPFPWHFGGQSYHNLFVDADEIHEFCSQNKNVSICLDTSHSMMACKYFGWDFFDFTKKIARYVNYLHLADSKGVDGEGIDFGEGDIDWMEFIKFANVNLPNIPFIPEIWQGHINNGAGFWKALNHLDDRQSH